MDDIILKAGARELHPEGPVAATLVDVVDLGMRVSEFSGRTSASQSCALIFISSEQNSQGFPFTLSKEMNVSFGAKSNLRRFLETWRGRAFTADELAAGFSLSSLVGKGAMVSVQHKTSQAGNVRADIVSAMSLPKGMAAPSTASYKRADFWAQRKAQYAQEYAEFVGSGVPKGDASYHGPIENAGGDDQSIPF